MRVGIYGGSFDPIHRGHVEPAVFASRSLGLDLFLFVPAYAPPHKPGGPTASAFHRFAMTALAIAPHERLRVSDFEAARGGTTYTIDTLAHFRELLPGHEIVLVLGSDSLATFATWRAWREIAETTRIAVLTREPWDRGATFREAPPELAARFAPDGATLSDAPEGGTIVWADNPPVTISSTWVRSALREGKQEARDALPPAVRSYLSRHGLYAAATPPVPSSPLTS
jgi:nicotinate-nucleotide adenylyltransferase